MNTKVKNIIKLLAMIFSIVILIILCFLILAFDNARKEELNTPVNITPLKRRIQPQLPEKIITPTIQKPVTRDENDVPKSDYKVPEIG